MQINCSFSLSLTFEWRTRFRSVWLNAPRKCFGGNEKSKQKKKKSKWASIFSANAGPERKETERKCLKLELSFTFISFFTLFWPFHRFFFFFFLFVSSSMPCVCTCTRFRVVVCVDFWHDRKTFTGRAVAWIMCVTMTVWRTTMIKPARCLHVPSARFNTSKNMDAYLDDIVKTKKKSFRGTATCESLSIAHGKPIVPWFWCSLQITMWGYRFLSRLALTLSSCFTCIVRPKYSTDYKLQDNRSLKILWSRA